jgi:hypothetical protein
VDVAFGGVNMDETKDKTIFEENLFNGPLLPLEKKLIKKYLRDKGYSLKGMRELPEEQAKKLLTEACAYASLKLAEVEAKSHFREKIRF